MMGLPPFVLSNTYSFITLVGAQSILSNVKEVLAVAGANFITSRTTLSARWVWRVAGGTTSE